MSTCPECGQLLTVDEPTHCPACGHDLHARRLQPVEEIDHDPEQDSEELLTAAIATEGTGHAPPPWVPSLEDRVAPARRRAADTEEVGDVVPGDDDKKTFWRRRR